nr:MAG TPA: Protein of unknown function (DUF1651) [Caudoviricetes sp.]
MGLGSARQARRGGALEAWYGFVRQGWIRCGRFGLAWRYGFQRSGNHGL